MIALVTGRVGCGKTTACGRTLDLLQEAGVTVGGILSPARLDTGGAKIGIDVIDVATGERRHLADCVCGGGRTIGNYSFNPRVLSWASARIRTAVAACFDLIVVDEIGPLELVHRNGLVAALDLLADPRAVLHALVIVRQAYLDRLKRRLGRPDLSCFWVDEGCREGLAFEIAAALEASIRNDGS